jgi:hypothetical protein
VAQTSKGRTAKDVQVGLNCKLALRQGQWRDAEGFHSQLHNKGSIVHKYLRAELLRQKALDLTVLQSEQKEATEEADLLMKELASVGATFAFISDEID